VTAASQALDASSFLYLRCNSTGWDVKSTNRLAPGNTNGVLELVYDVGGAPWLATDGDDCVITETPLKDAWGTWQKSYGLYYYNFTLAVPATATVREPAAGENPYFKVRYTKPGRYRAYYDTRQKTLSIRAADAAAPGEVAWTSNGYMIQDAVGNFYKTVYGEQQTLSRVNPDNGTELWTRTGASYVTPIGSCGDSTKLIASAWSGTRGVFAVSASTGQNLWHQTIGGELSGDNVYPSISCEPATSYVLVRWGENNEKVAAIAKSNGSVLWKRTLTAWTYTVAYDAQRAYFSAYDYDNGVGTYHAVSATTGQDVWQFQLPTSSSLFFLGGVPYTIAGNQVSRVDPATGIAKWTFNSSEASAWPSLSGSALYITEASKWLARVDTATGKALWKANLETTQGYRYPTYLTDGSVLLTTSVYDATTSTNKLTLDYLNPSTGAVRWTRNQTGNYYNSLLDTSVSPAQLFLTYRNAMTRVDVATGKDVWTGIAPRVVTEGMFPGGVWSVVSKDASKLYATYGTQGYKYQPGGIVAFDRNTGALRWDYFAGSPLSYIGTSNTKLLAYVMFGNQVVAIQK
jgi:outer membrane protein assembly factor BamB